MATEDSLAPPDVKSPTAYRTISEVAVELNVPQHVLRFWESKFAQIRPMKRSGGRRYYRREDIEVLHRIRKLLYDEGYTIKGVQRVLKSRNGEAAKPETDKQRLKSVYDQLARIRSDIDRVRRLR